MSLGPGARLGPYEIVSAIGAGGMGEVYLATDTNLGRQVAIKVLPEAFAQDAERLARFEREAKTLASLNHPHIAQIYGLEKSSGVHALVMELVEGEDLSQRIARGPIPLDEALPIVKQIAEALEAAHEQGIIHRDLKPANIKVRSDGTVKVLDFGLAKALEPAVAAGRDASLSPTITSPAMMTSVGVLLGTAAYMSPEQARGKAADRRSDIWAFGCVVYEMLAGRPLFNAVGIADTLARVITKEPDYSVLPANMPLAILRLLRRCLQKEWKNRLADISDAKLEIHEALAELTAEKSARITAPGRARERGVLAVAVLAIVTALVAGVLSYRRSPAPDTRVYRSSILLPPGTSFGVVIPSSRFALSPDGRQLAFVAATAGGVSQLWLQPLDGLSAHPLPGTEGAASPFWSPDNRSIAFYAGGKLKIVDAAGGTPITLADAIGNPGGAWNRDNVILFSSIGTGSVIRRISASGGMPSPVTKLEDTNRETQHWAPFFLPDGRHFLYVAAGSKSGPNTLNGIYVTSLESPDRKLLVRGGSNAKYAEGHLFFMKGQTLMSQPFDPDRLELTGTPVPIAEEVAVGGLSGSFGGYAVSDNGVLAYQRGAGGDVSQLIWVDRTGKQLETIADLAEYGDVELSPDGRRVAVSIGTATGTTRDIWLVDLLRGLRTRFTFDPLQDILPTWSPNGDEIFFSSNRHGIYEIYRKVTSGSGNDDVLHSSDSGNEFPLSWSRDSRFALIGRGAAGAGDIWVLPLSGDQKPYPFVESSFDEYPAVFSFDGRWVAYASNESGRYEVYVAPFPKRGGKWQVSTAGGNYPRWRRDGRELFYLAPDNRLTAATVNGEGSGFEIGIAHTLFETRTLVNSRYMYDASPDGQRFLINTRVEQVSQPITLVVNWLALLRR
jgi:eukaryotic-like serine/threonine-protein kinase